MKADFQYLESLEVEELLEIAEEVAEIYEN